MKRLFAVALVTAALVAGNAATAMAGCAYGIQTLGGSINGGRTDSQRFFTSSGGPISIGVYANNGPLRVFLPGCGWNYGTSHSCTTYAGPGAEVHPIIVNPNPFTVTYSFACEG
jgi:hypothetical protein